MARVQVSTSSVNKNTSVAGNGIASGDGDLNDAVRGSSGGFGVIGTDGYGGTNSATQGNFEVLDALPGWYLRDLAVERTARLGGEAVDRTIATRVSSGATTGITDDTGVTRFLGLRSNIGNNTKIPGTSHGNFVVSDDSDSESVTVSVGDTISTTAAAGVIVDIYTKTTPSITIRC